MPRNPQGPRTDAGREQSRAVEHPRGVGPRPEGRRRLPALEALEGRRLMDASTPNPLVSEFPLPAPVSNPAQIVTGGDGALWFTETSSNQIGRITSAGLLTELPLPTPGSSPVGITLGPDGNVWFTEPGNNAIGRVTPAGALTEFKLPEAGSLPTGITTGPDGNLWFTETNGDRIGRITPLGGISEISLPTGSAQPLGITGGADGNIWFTESAAGQIGKLSPTTGAITEFLVSGGQPNQITSGSDGNLWFTETGIGQIGRFNPFSSTLTEFPTPTALTQGAQGITVGPDHSIWFTEPEVDQLGRSDASGNITEVSLGSGAATPTGLTSGPGGNLWFTDPGANAVGTLDFQIPIVTLANRLGNSDQVTGFVFTFSTALDPVNASNANNYIIHTPGHRGGNFDTPFDIFDGQARDTYLHLQRAVYNPQLHTVTVILTQPISVKQAINIRINGTFPFGVAGATGNFLNGAYGTTEGTNYSLTIHAGTLQPYGIVPIVTTPFHTSHVRAHARAAAHAFHHKR
jgi:virginiamycin B lyase